MSRVVEYGHPLWLHANPQHALTYDLDYYARRFLEDARRLFVPEGETWAKLLQLGQRDGEPEVALPDPAEC